MGIVQRLAERGRVEKKEGEKERVLLVLGEGIGNIVLGAFLIPNLKRKYKVDVLITKENYSCSDFLLNEVNVFKSENEVNTDQYTGKIETVWGKTRLNIPVIASSSIDFAKYPNEISEFRANYNILTSLGYEPKEITLDFNYNYNPKITDKFDIVLVNGANSQWSFKRYKYWKEVARELRKDYSICSVGSKDEYIPYTTDKTSLPFLSTLSLLKNSRLVVSNDTGLYHTACLLKIPGVVVFTGSSLEKNYDFLFHHYFSPVFFPCDRRVRCQFDQFWKDCKQKCREIPPEFVIEVVRQKLESPQVLVCFCSSSIKRLDTYLPSLIKAKNRVRFDIMIMCNGKMEGIDRIREDYGVKYIERLDRQFPVGTAKTMMVEKALKLNYPYYYLTDDDYVYTDYWLDTAMDALRKPYIGISTVFCHPNDWERFKHTQSGDFYFPESAMGGSMLIEKRVLERVYQDKAGKLKELKGLWDYNLSKTVNDYNLKVISTVNSYVQHNPDEIEIARPSKKGLGFVEKERPVISIIIPFKGHIEMTCKCLECIRKNSEGYEGLYQLVLVNDGQEDGQEDRLERIKSLLNHNDILVSNQFNQGFSVSCNRGARVAEADLLLFMNNDVELRDKKWLDKILKEIDNQCIAGCSIKYNEIVESQEIFRWCGDRRTEWGYVEGWFLVIRKELFEKLGMFDERFSPAFAEDADLCYQLKKYGGQLKLLDIEVYHHHAKTVNGLASKNELIERNGRLLYEKYGRDVVERICQESKEIIQRLRIQRYTSEKDIKRLVSIVRESVKNTRTENPIIIEVGTASLGTAIPLAITVRHGIVITFDTYQTKEVQFDDYLTNLKRVLKGGIENIAVIPVSSVEFGKNFDKKVDFVWIDGDHKYEAVREDIRVWGKKLRKGGYISGHDYDHVDGGVEKAVREMVEKNSMFGEVKVDGKVWWSEKVK